MLLLLFRRCSVPPAVRLTGLVVLHVTEVTAAGRRTGVQVLTAGGRRFDGGDRILGRQREQRFRGLGRMTNSAVVIMVIVMMVTMMMMPAVVVVVVRLMAVIVVMVMVVVFSAAFDVLQLQVHHVLPTATATPVTDDLVPVQVLVTEPVAAERLGG